MTILRTPGIRTAVRRTAAWLAIGLCVFYALYALSAAVAEILSLLGAAPGAKPRSMPPVFILHAITGAVALVTGALQLRFGRPLTRRRAKIHRALGRSYVVAACLTCLGGVVVTAAFDIGPIGRIVFTAWAASWLTATTIALRYIRRGQIAPHRRWMIRSFALALVFLTFDIARQALTAAELSRPVVYPLALALCVVGHTAASEWWIRTGPVRHATASTAIPPSVEAASTPGRLESGW